MLPPYLDMSLSLAERMELIEQNVPVHLTPTVTVTRFNGCSVRVKFAPEYQQFEMGEYYEGSKILNMPMWDEDADETYKWLCDDTEGGICRIGSQWYAFSYLDGDYLSEYHRTGSHTCISESDAKKLIEFFHLPEWCE